MGFEQLAALRDQLAKKAAAESPKGERKGPRKGAGSGASKGAPNRPRDGERTGAGADAPTGAKGRRPAPAAAQGKPVDPVVHSIARLQKHFPKAFPKNPAPKVPLKIGTFEDLTQHAAKLALSEAELREAIRTWCSGTRYWSCMVEGAKRLDLDGNEAGVVTLADAKRAQQLKARRAGGARPAKAKPAAAAAPATAEAPVTPETTESPASSVTPETPETPATPATP
ncbi:ProQ activator of osmoprotectant transporter prop [Cupriavidus necator]|uniref:ProQ/FinO family protein n=1 Tax=Cupriavidus necator TaxID=106590 RepID=UPI00148F989A|nr:ProQ/FinO family protein [Cupriavidus necator]NOV22096.1 ProQ activator of osmoprotectant transporter prop [Cupriavidus necator]